MLSCSLSFCVPTLAVDFLGHVVHVVDGDSLGVMHEGGIEQDRAATPVRIGHVAGTTRMIRVGSGGAMLPNHSSLVVAVQFGTLEALYPGVGLGHAPDIADRVQEVRP